MPRGLVFAFLSSLPHLPPALPAEALDVYQGTKKNNNKKMHLTLGRKGETKDMEAGGKRKKETFQLLVTSPAACPRALSYTSGVRNSAFPTPNPAAEVEELTHNWEIAHGATACAPLATCLGYLASLPWQEGCQLQAAPRVPAHAAADRAALAELPSPRRGDRLCSQPGGRRHPARCRSAGGTQPATNASHRLGAKGGISFY